MPILEKIPKWIIALSLLFLVILIFMVRASGESVTIIPFKFHKPIPIEHPEDLVLSVKTFEFAPTTINKLDEISKIFTLKDNCSPVSIKLPKSPMANVYFGTTNDTGSKTGYSQFRGQDDFEKIRIWVVNNTNAPVAIPKSKFYVYSFCYLDNQS